MVNNNSENDNVKEIDKNSVIKHDYPISVLANEIAEIVEKDNVFINEPMSKHTSFKVGGNADIFAKIDSEHKLRKILDLKEIKEKILPLTIVGNGSNLIVKDNGVRGVVIKYTASKCEIENANNNAFIAKVDSGIVNANLANILLENELSGFEFASGIPGTIGGAVVMNAGAYGSEMGNIVEDVTYIDLIDNAIKTVNNAQCNFSYRNSKFQNELKNSIIISVRLLLNKANKENIKNKIDEYKSKRIASQPLDKPSAGSTFKRGTDFVTAQLIDEAGLKGYKIGGAQISQKHAGFIINTGNATAKDIIDLINYVQEKVYEKFNKKIEAEVRIIGQ